jgi:hypothetical protein
MTVSDKTHIPTMEALQRTASALIVARARASTPLRWMSPYSTIKAGRVFAEHQQHSRNAKGKNETNPCPKGQNYCTSAKLRRFGPNYNWTAFCGLFRSGDLIRFRWHENRFAHPVQKLLIGRSNRRERSSEFYTIRFHKEVGTKADPAFQCP